MSELQAKSVQRLRELFGLGQMSTEDQIAWFVHRHTILFGALIIIPAVVIIALLSVASVDITNAGAQCSSESNRTKTANNYLIVSAVCLAVLAVIAVGLLIVYDKVLVTRMLDLLKGMPAKISFA